jgi:alpha-L-rhamnosidase
MYAHVAGIDRDEAALAWKKIRVRPTLGGGLRHARGMHESPRGRVASAWRLEGKDQRELALDVEVPVHALATVHVPAASADAVTEGGRPARSAPGVRLVEQRDGAAIFEVGSGVYRFRAPRP